MFSLNVNYFSNNKSLYRFYRKPWWFIHISVVLITRSKNKYERNLQGLTFLRKVSQ